MFYTTIKRGQKMVILGTGMYGFMAIVGVVMVRHVVSGSRDIPHCWGDIVCWTLVPAVRLHTL